MDIGQLLLEVRKRIVWLVLVVFLDAFCLGWFVLCLSGHWTTASGIGSWKENREFGKEVKWAASKQKH